MVTTGSNRIVVGYDDSRLRRRWAAAVGRHTGADDRSCWNVDAGHPVTTFDSTG
jgi:hypothetical protein